MAEKGRIAALGSVLAICAVLFFVSGCGNKKEAQPTAVPVAAISITPKDTPLTFVYPGVVKAMNEVNVQSRVSGSIVAKYIQGGQQVSAGQALYKIDDSTYISALNQARANLAQAEAQLSNAQQDLSRYAMLIKSGGISAQTYTNQEHTVAAYQAAVAANQAMVNRAQTDYNNTTVYAPISGRLGVNDVSTGTYATAGNTTLVTLGSINPVFVQFNISENEYLQFNRIFNGNFVGKEVHLTLSDGSTYPIAGKIVQVDKQALANGTGTLTVKAVFANPQHLLLPGMFTRISFTGETVKNAILVPQLAVQQMLDKSYVMVVGADNKAKMTMVTLGAKTGDYQIITSGLKAGDKVIVEGLTTLRPDTPIQAKMLNMSELTAILNNQALQKPDAKTTKK